MRVPVNTRREPSVVVITLALTPGLFGAELMAAAMPASVLLVVSMVMSAERPPTAIVNVPLPTAPVLDSGADVATGRRGEIVHE